MREFKLPPLGDGVDAGIVAKVLVSPGDRVDAGQSVLEIETNKAIAEVPVDAGGIVAEVRVREGEQVQPGQVILTLNEVSAAGAEEGEKSEPAAARPKPGDAAARPDGVVASAKEEAEPEEQGAKPGEAAAAPAATDAARPSTTADAAQPQRPSGELIPAAPSTRRLARELGVDIAQVEGSGPGGRITIEDVKAKARALLAGQAASSSAPGARAAEPALPDFSRWGPVERRPLGGVRRASAAHLSAVWAAVPQVTHFEAADVTELEKLRREYGPRVEAAGGKLTPTAILLKVVAGALKAFPRFNSSLDAQTGELVYKKYYHIGVAVDTEHGLLVPVIRDVDRKSILELALELGEVAERARRRELTAEEMQGGCFTLSNLGGIGGRGFTPIVNAPEVAILGVARSRVEPVYQDGAFVPRTVMPLALSYDHRVIDGADAARFMRWVKEALEDPFLIALHG